MPAAFNQKRHIEHRQLLFCAAILLHKLLCTRPHYFMDDCFNRLERFLIVKNALSNLGSVQRSFLTQIFLAQYSNYLRQSFAACRYCQACFGVCIKNRQSQAAQLRGNCTFTGSNASRQTNCYHSFSTPTFGNAHNKLCLCRQPSLSAAARRIFCRACPRGHTPADDSGYRPYFLRRPYNRGRLYHDF